jgi:hypothetical protein
LDRVEKVDRLNVLRQSGFELGFLVHPFGIEDKPSFLKNNLWLVLIGGILVFLKEHNSYLVPAGFVCMWIGLPRYRYFTLHNLSKFFKQGTITLIKNEYSSLFNQLYGIQFYHRPYSYTVDSPAATVIEKGIQSTHFSDMYLGSFDEEFNPTSGSDISRHFIYIEIRIPDNFELEGFTTKLRPNDYLITVSYCYINNETSDTERYDVYMFPANKKDFPKTWDALERLIAKFRSGKK